MSFQSGRTKTGGREKGKPNLRTERAAKILEELDIDPVRELASLAKQDIELPAKIQVLKELAQYVYPKRKAIEYSGADDSDERTEKADAFIAFLKTGKEADVIAFMDTSRHCERCCQMLFLSSGSQLGCNDF